MVTGTLHTNGIESLWAVLKRSHKGIYHQWSRKHTQRYVNECCGRLNIRKMDALDQIGEVVRGMDGKLLTYKMLKDTPIMHHHVKSKPSPMDKRWTWQRSMRKPEERLTTEERQEIINQHRSGRGGYKVIVRKFNVSANVVRDVVLGLRKYDRPGRPPKRL